MSVKKQKKTPRGKRKCPRCGKTVTLADNPYRPFCSRRCKMIDLGAWFNEEYTILEPFLPETESDEEKG